MLKQVVLFMFLLTVNTAVAQETKLDIEELEFNPSIVGEWISEEDTRWKWVFTADGECKDYYSGVLKNTYTYTISNTSPRCGRDVHIDRNTSYLSLTKVSNTPKKICYEINGVTDTHLSIRALGRGGAIVFDRN